MPSDSYAYANGRIKIIENALLEDQQLQRLRELPFEAAVRQLGDWGYAADYPVREDVDALIDFRMREIHVVVDDVTPDKALTDLFWLSLDAVNVKYLIKARMLGSADAGQDELEKGVCDIALLRDCVQQQDYAPLGEPLAALLTEADAPNPDAAPKDMSAAIDRAFYRYIFDVLKDKHNPFCTAFFTAKADFANLLSLLRSAALGWPAADMAEMLVPGGDIPREIFVQAYDLDAEKRAEMLAAGSQTETIKQALALLETQGATAVSDLFNAALLHMAANERFDSFGIGPIAYFLLRGTEECRTLRVLFARKRIRSASQEN